jgi:molybdate transport system substrate-binding protein
VPAGRYARAAFEGLGLTAALGEKIVNGDHVRSVLRWVAAGEVDAGVVYATDAVVEPKVRVAFVFPPESHPPIVYPMAALRGAPPAAGEFLRFCRGTVGLPIFLRAGFTALG